MCCSTGGGRESGGGCDRIERTIVHRFSTAGQGIYGQYSKENSVLASQAAVVIISGLWTADAFKYCAYRCVGVLRWCLNAAVCAWLLLSCLEFFGKQRACYEYCVTELLRHLSLLPSSRFISPGIFGQSLTIELTRRIVFLYVKNRIAMAGDRSPVSMV